MSWHPKFSLGLEVWYGYMGLQRPYTPIIRRQGADESTLDPNHVVTGVRLVGEDEEDDDWHLKGVAYPNGWEYLLVHKITRYTAGWFTEQELIDLGYTS